jgi:ferredoxin--NADP+ reductase
VRVAGHDDDGAPGELIDTQLILKSIGYRGSAPAGVPFDTGRGVVPNEHGRVLDEQNRPVPGVYVTGWIKRGPRGVIGTNRTCAQESLTRLWEDYDSGLLNRTVCEPSGIGELLADRNAEPLNWHGWKAIDAAERDRGDAASRPRVKFVDIADMLVAARG